jgi:serine protease DegQ
MSKKSKLYITSILTIFTIFFNSISLYAGFNITQILKNEQASLAPMLKNVLPSVVNIKIYNKQRYLQLLKEQQANHGGRRMMPPMIPENGMIGMGSGVVINGKDGIIVTNNHVIDGAEKIIVTLHDGRNANAKLIGSDPDSDLAVLKVNTDGLTELKFADSEQAEIGDFVVAIGSPFGLNQTVTSGIISSKGRVIGLEGYEDFIQTDASINPGNSGGALINLKGELIGINTAILAPDGGSIGIGFAIPSNMAGSILEQLLRFGKVRRGLLGVVAQTLTPELAEAFGNPKQKGALVDTIARDSIAFNSELKIGDIIDEVNGKKINNATDLRNTIGLTPINQDIKVGVIRNGKRRTVGIKLLDPAEIKTRAQKIYPALAGAYLDPVDDVRIPHMGRLKGLKLLDVVIDSPAWQQGLRDDDIILSVNNKNVTNMDELEKAISDKTKPLLLQVVRKNNSYFKLLKASA